MITSSILMVVLKIVSPLVSLFKPINVLVNSTFSIRCALFSSCWHDKHDIRYNFSYVGYTCYNCVFTRSVGYFTDCIKERVYLYDKSFYCYICGVLGFA